LRIDTDARAAYLEVSNEPVSRTVELDEAVVVVDLDEAGRVVGVEILNYDLPTPVAPRAAPLTGG
jgi:uncharacterized protein YuzE